jgi:hypothetical protein
VARATGGVYWSAGGNARDEDEMKEVYEEWARPLHVDRVSLTGLRFEVPARLDEGQAVEIEQIDETPARAVVVAGELWSSPIRTTLQPDAAYAKAWSAMVFGSDLLNELSEAEMMTLAKAGHAVSPVTSLLAIEPGVRPSTEGLEEDGSGQGFGSGHGRLGGSHVTRSPTIRTFNPAQWLADRLGREWKTCDTTGTRTAQVRVETTLDEVVDVPSLTITPAAPDAIGTCLAEAVWALDLPFAFDSSHATYDVQL